MWCKWSIAFSQGRVKVWKGIRERDTWCGAQASGMAEEEVHSEAADGREKLTGINHSRQSYLSQGPEDRPGCWWSSEEGRHGVKAAVKCSKVGGPAACSGHVEMVGGNASRRGLGPYLCVTFLRVN